MPVIIEQCNDLPAMREMFEARAKVFCGRLGWDVATGDLGEMDEIDRRARPIYFNYVDDDGMLIGSLRVVSTAGKTVLAGPHGNDFLSLPAMRSARRWECSRFFVLGRPTVGDSSRVASALFLALCQHGLEMGITAIIATYAPPMRRIYARLGWKPRRLSETKPGVPAAEIGIWRVSELALHSIQAHADNRERAGRRPTVGSHDLTAIRNSHSSSAEQRYAS